MLDDPDRRERFLAECRELRRASAEARERAWVLAEEGMWLVESLREMGRALPRRGPGGAGAEG